MAQKRTLKIVKLYAISVLCIVCYYLLDNSTIIPELVEQANKGHYYGFFTFFITGLIKHGLWVVGIGISVMLSYLLLKEKFSKTD